MAEDQLGQPFRVMVFRFGAPTRGGQHAYRLPDRAVAQLRLGHELGNRLVELALRKDERIAVVWSMYPQVAAAEAVLAAAEEKAQQAARAVAQAKIAQRTRTPTDPAVDDLRAARKAAKEARIARREAIASVVTDAKAHLEAAVTEHRAAVKALYGEFVQARGLYWATHNDLVDHSRAADRRVSEMRKQGRPARRRFRPWDGSGTLAVQLQRGAGEPLRTPELLASGGGKWRTVLQLPAETGPGVVRFGLGSKLPPIEIPVKIHRLIPPAADIIGARLVVERVAGRQVISVHLTAKIPVGSKKDGDGPTIAVHLGWRRDGENRSVRVASWRSDTDLTVPDRLRNLVVKDTSASGRIILPGAWRDRMNEFDQVRSVRDLALNQIRDQLVAWLRENPPQEANADQRVVTIGQVHAWRSSARFARLALEWRDHPPRGGEKIAAQLESWRRADRAAWEREANGREKAIGRRRDAYQQAAAWLASTAAMIVVEDTDLAALIGRSKRGTLPGVVEDRAAAQRVDAAPGELRTAIVTAAAREQMPVVVVKHQAITLTHHECGHANPADERWAADEKVLCDGCGRVFDQDSNATRGMLARAAQWPPHATKGVAGAWPRTL